MATPKKATKKKSAKKATKKSAKKSPKSVSKKRNDEPEDPPIQHASNKQEKSPLDFTPEKGIAAIFIIAIVVLLGAIVFMMNQGVVPLEIEEDVLATVNGQSITQEQFDGIKLAALQLDPTLDDKIILNQTIMIALLRQKATELNITPNEIQVALIIAQREALVKSQYGEDGYDEFLNLINMTEEEYKAAERRAIEDDIVIGQVFEKEVFSNLENITDGEALTYYEQNQAVFGLPEQREISHILLCYEGATACTRTMPREQAQTLAQDILIQLRDRPQDFERLAREESTGPSAPASGNIGVMTANQLVPEFSGVAFALQVNEISEVVETEFGFHIIRVDDIVAPMTPGFEDVQDIIKQQLLTEQGQQAQREYMLGLYEAADIEVFI